VPRAEERNHEVFYTSFHLLADTNIEDTHKNTKWRTRIARS
jgi:hypothetical protein